MQPNASLALQFRTQLWALVHHCFTQSMQNVFTPVVLGLGTVVINTKHRYCLYIVWLCSVLKIKKSKAKEPKEKRLMNLKVKGRHDHSISALAHTLRLYWALFDSLGLCWALFACLGSAFCYWLNKRREKRHREAPLAELADSAVRMEERLRKTTQITCNYT